MALCNLPHYLKEIQNVNFIRIGYNSFFFLVYVKDKGVPKGVGEGVRGSNISHTFGPVGNST